MKKAERGESCRTNAKGKKQLVGNVLRAAMDLIAQCSGCVSARSAKGKPQQPREVLRAGQFCRESSWNGASKTFHPYCYKKCLLCVALISWIAYC